MARKPQDNPQLDMTPMIDVVFELIIFFVVTIKQEDLFTKLNCNRPAPPPPTQTVPKDEPDVTIEIGRRYDGSPQGVILYNKLKNGCTRADLVAALMAEYEVSEEIASQDTDAFLNQMRQLGMLVED